MTAVRVPDELDEYEAILTHNLTVAFRTRAGRRRTERALKRPPRPENTGPGRAAMRAARRDARRPRLLVREGDTVKPGRTMSRREAQRFYAIRQVHNGRTTRRAA